jgi:hypothetical protein
MGRADEGRKVEASPEALCADHEIGVILSEAPQARSRRTFRFDRLHAAQKVLRLRRPSDGSAQDDSHKGFYPRKLDISGLLSDTHFMPDSLSVRPRETVADLIRRHGRPLALRAIDIENFRACAVALCSAEVAHRSRDFLRVERPRPPRR